MHAARFNYECPLPTIFRAQAMESSDFEVYNFITGVSILLLYQHIKKVTSKLNYIKRVCAEVMADILVSMCLSTARTSIANERPKRTYSKCPPNNRQSTDHNARSANASGNVARYIACCVTNNVYSALREMCLIYQESVS